MRITTYLNSLRAAVAWSTMVAAVLGGGALAQAQNRTEDRPSPPPIPSQVKQADGDFAFDVELAVDPAAGAPADKDFRQGEFKLNVSATGYWIGLQLEAVTDTLRSHLNLPAGQGLVVNAVVSGAPASKAGFKQHDVVIKVNDKPIADLEVFNKEVTDAKDGKELSVTVIRGGQPAVLKVTPAKRPADDWNLNAADPNAEVMRRFFMDLGAGGDVREPLRVELFHPGVVFWSNQRGELPKGLSVSIHRTGGEPAKITVKRDNTTWDVTEKELDKLPDDLRPHVDAILGNRIFNEPAPPAPHVRSLPGRADVVVPNPNAPGKRSIVTRIDKASDRSENVPARLDEMNRRLETLQKALDLLVKQQDEKQRADADKHDKQ